MNELRENQMALEPGSVALKIGIKLITRVAPQGIRWVSTWIKGKKILIIGQPQAGKTSFVRYFRYGIFADPSTYYRSRRIKKTPAFTVRMGRDQSLQLEVRSTIDTVGQVMASDHADNVSKFKPDSVIIILDLSAEWKGENEYAAGFYMEEFSDSLSHKLNRSKRLAEKIKSIIIVLNKKDLVKPQKISSWNRNISKILHQKLMQPWGIMSKDIPIMSCTLIEGKDKGKTPDEIITKIAISLV